MLFAAMDQHIYVKRIRTKLAHRSTITKPYDYTDIKIYTVSNQPTSTRTHDIKLYDYIKL
jgi:hypothetical protein